MLSKLLIYFFIYKIYYNWLTNLKISYFFKNVHPHFMEQMYHVMLSLNYYISLQLQHFFFFSNISMIPNLLKPAF